MVVRSQRPARRRHPRDRGAAAVEFALVSPLLFMLLFGILDYGLFMADVLSVQQGVGDGAREATLAVGSTSANWPGDGNCGASLRDSGAVRVGQR